MSQLHAHMRADDNCDMLLQRDESPCLLLIDDETIMSLYKPVTPSMLCYDATLMETSCPRAAHCRCRTCHQKERSRATGRGEETTARKIEKKKVEDELRVMEKEEEERTGEEDVGAFSANRELIWSKTNVSN